VAQINRHPPPNGPPSAGSDGPFPKKLRESRDLGNVRFLCEVSPLGL
jgi:hypothetical protein